MSLSVPVCGKDPTMADVAMWVTLPRWRQPPGLPGLFKPSREGINIIRDTPPQPNRRGFDILQVKTLVLLK